MIWNYDNCFRWHTKFGKICTLWKFYIYSTYKTYGILEQLYVFLITSCKRFHSKLPICGKMKRTTIQQNFFWTISRVVGSHRYISIILYDTKLVNSQIPFMVVKKFQKQRIGTLIYIMKISHCSKWWSFAKYDEVFNQNRCGKTIVQKLQH
jgi:hypothetical protein